MLPMHELAGLEERISTVAVPFCHVRLRGQKPLPTTYPNQLRTQGDHPQKRRLDLGLRQKDVAKQLGVNKDTIRNWEVGRASPALWQWPGLIRFLGYVPFCTDGNLPKRLKAYRQVHALSQKRLAQSLGVDPSTVWHWEQGRSRPRAVRAARIAALLNPLSAGVSRPVEQPRQGE